VTIDIKRISDALRKYPTVHSAALRAYRTSHLPLAVARRPYQIRKYLGSARDFAGLQIGAGPHGLPGWLKTDLDPDFSTVYLNATRRFPFADETFDYVVAEHMIEHVSYEAALAMLQECRRVLKKGGVVRISTPDIQLTRRLMDRPLAPELERYVQWSNQRYGCAGDPDSAVQVVNRLQHAWGHQFLYDADTMADALRRAGFAETVQCCPGDSAHAALMNVDGHAQVIGAEFNELESLIIEAVK
jgi:SAM-dependent methyltransferase